KQVSPASPSAAMVSGPLREPGLMTTCSMPAAAREPMIKRDHWVRRFFGAYMLSNGWGGLERAVAEPQRGADALELELGLFVFAPWLGRLHDTCASIQMDVLAVEQGAAQADDEVAVAARVGPAERCGVPAAWGRFVRRDEVERRLQGGAADGGRGVDAADELQHVLAARQPPGDGRTEMEEPRQLFDGWR